MNKIYLFAALALSGMSSFVSAQTVVHPQYDKPYVYELRDSILQVKTYFKLPETVKQAVATIDGKQIQSTVSNGKLQVWMPLIADPINICVKDKKNKKTLIDEAYSPLIPKDWGYFSKGMFHIIQSSHQDIAWMDTPKACMDDRIDNIILPALEMQRKDKDFTFEMEQTLNLMEFLQVHPEYKKEVIQRSKEKRFAWGATYNQPYEGLSSGEQLVRQAYYGRKWIMENLPGCDDHTANNVDVPGRSLQFAQIMAKSGINNLVVSRLREGLYDWYSPDGSHINTFSPGNYGWVLIKWKFFDDDAITALHKLHHRAMIWSSYFKKHHIPPHYAVLVSCDSKKPRDFQNVIREWNKIARLSKTPLPTLVNSTAEEYFKTIKGADTHFETIRGERPDLWLYIHGPAHYEATVFKREAANLLPDAELFTSMDELNNNDLNIYPRSEFDRAWRASIYPDHGLGGNHGDITDSIFSDSLKLARDMGQQLLSKSLSAITEEIKGNKNTLVVYNDLTWNRNGLVTTTYPDKETWKVKDAKGKDVPCQYKQIENGKTQLAFEAENIPGIGYASYQLVKGKQKESIPTFVKTTSNSYENKLIKAVLGNGGIQSLIDKKTGREIFETSKFAAGDVLEAGYRGNGAGEFTEVTDLDFDTQHIGQQAANWHIVNTGALSTTFENKQPTAFTTVIQRITFYHDSNKIDFDITLENFTGEHNRQYRITMPLAMRDAKIEYEVPMGILHVGKDEMKSIPGGWAWNGTYGHYPVETHPREVQNFITASGNGYGVTMSSCVAVCDWIDPSKERADYPILQGILLSSHKSCHGSGNWFSQKGTHHYHFSVMYHKPGWKNGYQFGLAENHPLIGNIKQNNKGNESLQKQFIAISDPLVQLNMVKKADNGNGIIIRLTNMENRDKTITVTLPKEVRKVVHTNLIEQELNDMNLSGKTINLNLGHNAIETYKLDF